MRFPLSLSSRRSEIKISLPMRFQPAFWIILGACLFRMIGLTRPLLGNFSTYQTAQAMMAKFFVEEGFRNLLYPKLNILVQGEPGLQLLYYPISSLVTAILVACFGGEYGVWGRFQAVIFFGLTAFWLFRLVRELVDERVSFYALVAFSLCPLTIIYGQSFQSEMAALFFSVLFFYELLRLLKEGGFRHFAVSCFALSFFLLVRPNGLHLLLPALYLGWVLPRREKGPWKRVGDVLSVFAVSLILPALWYFHVWRVSHEMRNIYQTIYSQVMLRSSFASPLILNPNFYRNLLDVVSGVVLTPVGFTLFLLGCLLSLGSRTERSFFLIWCLSFAGSSLLIPRKLVDQNFYWLHFVVGASGLIGMAWKEIREALIGLRRFQKGLVVSFGVIVFLISLRYALHPAFKTGRKEASIPLAAQKLKEFSEKSKSRIVVQGSHALLYYADRFGWGFDIRGREEISDYLLYTNWERLPEEQWKKRNEAFRNPISALEYLREYEGATHFVTTDLNGFYRHSNFSNYLHSKFRLLSEEKGQYLIFAIQKT